MDSEYIQRVRYKLDKRLERLTKARFDTFHWLWLQTWAFLRENDITRGILDDLAHRFPKAQAIAEDMFQTGRPKVGPTETEHVAICYFLMKKCAASSSYTYIQELGHTSFQKATPDTHVDVFRAVYVEPLFDYIGEQIDDKRVLLFLLRKYKHRCEWFHRTDLLAKCKENTRIGEGSLALDLYEYLHDQGVQFYIEPKSASGRIDLISTQSGKDRLVADVKIFTPDRGQNVSYIIKGFRQLYDYARDYNEPFGYLAIFKTCDQDLCIDTANQESAVPFVTYNNKTIFFLVIDLCEYEVSASKRGKLMAHEITMGALIESLSAQEVAATLTAKKD
jgi:hypothetical protein